MKHQGLWGGGSEPESSVNMGTSGLQVDRSGDNTSRPSRTAAWASLVAKGRQVGRSPWSRIGPKLGRRSLDIFIMLRPIVSVARSAKALRFPAP